MKNSRIFLEVVKYFCIFILFFLTSQCTREDKVNLISNDLKERAVSISRDTMFDVYLSKCVSLTTMYEQSFKKLLQRDEEEIDKIFETNTVRQNRKLIIEMLHLDNAEYTKLLKEKIVSLQYLQHHYLVKNYIESIDYSTIFQHAMKLRKAGDTESRLYIYTADLCDEIKSNCRANAAAQYTTEALACLGSLSVPAAGEIIAPVCELAAG